MVPARFQNLSTCSYDYVDLFVVRIFIYADYSINELINELFSLLTDILHEERINDIMSK
jgi:hypothetical protein